MVKNLPANAEDLNSIPQLGKSPRLGNGNLLHNYYLGNPTNRRGLRATAHGVARVGHNLAAKLSWECVISSVLSCHNKNLKRWMDQHYSPRMDQCYSSVLLYLKSKGKYILETEEMPTQRTQREKRPLLPQGLPYVKLASQGCCLFYLRSLL